VASHKSALKRIRQTRKRTELNRMYRSKLRHQIRKLRIALDSKDKSAAQALLAPTFSLIEHSVRVVRSPCTSSMNS
jgi:small subunit ribosomal protein S20